MNKEEGIEMSEQHANAVHRNWSDMAYLALKGYLKDNPGKTFICENVIDTVGNVPEPPTLKAWGSIIRRAVSDGVIKKVGTSNNKAHRAIVSVWVEV